MINMKWEKSIDLAYSETRSYHTLYADVDTRTKKHLLKVCRILHDIASITPFILKEYLTVGSKKIEPIIINEKTLSKAKQKAEEYTLTKIKEYLDELGRIAALMDNGKD